MEPCRHERSRFIQIHDVSVEVCCFCAATVVDPEPFTDSEMTAVLNRNAKVTA